MKKKVRDNSSVPPGGMWVYVHPETGIIIQHPYFNVCKGRVKAFLRANNYPVGSNFDEDFEENICSHAAAGVCDDFVPPTLMEKMGTLAQALYRAAISGRAKIVDAEEVQRRRSICEACNYYGGSRSLLKIACQRCGCSGLALYLEVKHCPLSPPKW